MVDPPVTVAYDAIGDLDIAVDEGTPVVDGHGELVGICTHRDRSGSTEVIEVVLDEFTVKRRRRSPCTSLPPGESGTDEHESRAVKPESQREPRLCGEGRPSASTPSSRSNGRTPTSQDSVLL